MQVVIDGAFEQLDLWLYVRLKSQPDERESTLAMIDAQEALKERFIELTGLWYE